MKSKTMLAVRFPACILALILAWIGGRYTDRHHWVGNAFSRVSVWITLVLLIISGVALVWSYVLKKRNGKPPAADAFRNGINNAINLIFGLLAATFYAEVFRVRVWQVVLFTVVTAVLLYLMLATRYPSSRNGADQP